MFVKVCGTTSEEDGLLAVAMGADAVGFVFAPSKRQIAPRLAGEIARRLPPEIITVGVFQNEAPQRVVDIIQASGLKAAQLYGRESPEQTRWIRARVPLVIQAFSAGDPAVAKARDHHADAVLIDSASPGSGQVFDWSLAEGVPAGMRLIIAGGLTADNVGEAIARVSPWGVDVATGVEKQPGHKDPVKLRNFVAAARAAGGTDYEPLEAGPYDWEDQEL
jgi:phosphoribosylanthranilate isomerase